MIKKGEMPLNSYLWIHGTATLSANDQSTLVNWTEALMKEIAIKNNLPAEEKK